MIVVTWVRPPGLLHLFSFYSGLTSIANVSRISGDLNLIIIVVFANVATCKCFTIFLLHAVFIYVLFFCNNMLTRASGMHLGESVMVCFGNPRTSGWLNCTKPWLPSPTRLGNRPLCPFGRRILHSQRPQHQIECLKRHCRLRDVKCVTTSCHNDVMISYKRSRLVGNAVLWLILSLATDRQSNRQPSFVQLCALPEPFWRLSLFPWIKLCF